MNDDSGYKLYIHRYSTYDFFDLRLALGHFFGPKYSRISGDTCRSRPIYILASTHWLDSAAWFKQIRSNKKMSFSTSLIEIVFMYVIMQLQ